MIELRPDGSRRGPDRVARIYRIGYEGKLDFNIWRGEKSTDSTDHVEKYATFRGWATDFIRIDDEFEILKELRDNGFSKIELEREKLEYLKEQMHKAREAAEKAAAAYFSACPVGPERIWASNVFDNIRNAMRDA